MRKADTDLRVRHHHEARAVVARRPDTRVAVRLAELRLRVGDDRVAVARRRRDLARVEYRRGPDSRVRLRRELGCPLCLDLGDDVCKRDLRVDLRLEASVLAIGGLQLLLRREQLVLLVHRRVGALLGVELDACQLRPRVREITHQRVVALRRDLRVLVAGNELRDVDVEADVTLVRAGAAVDRARALTDERLEAVRLGLRRCDAIPGVRRLGDGRVQLQLNAVELLVQRLGLLGIGLDVGGERLGLCVEVDDGSAVSDRSAGHRDRDAARGKREHSASKSADSPPQR